MAAFSQSPYSKRFTPIAALLVVLIAFYLTRKAEKPPPSPDTVTTVPAGPGEYLFCSWNVENLFDDVHDQRNSIDAPYDSWFASKPDDLNLKLSHLADAMVRLNGGKGPDILCAVEVESKRAADLLAEALNKKLPEGASPYTTVVMEEVVTGRHIGPAIISRLPLSSRGKPRLFAPHRILRASLEAGGAELVIFATHWTSRRSDDTGGQRAKYANRIYGSCNEVYHANPKADIVVCGDFNDQPDDPAVRDTLRAGDDLAAVRDANDLKFLNLMAGKDPAKFGTHYYNKPLIYDHICVSPGLLDNQGWSADIGSIQSVTQGLAKSGSTVRPWRFGNEKDTFSRGFSDHFPVAVKLKVNAPPP